VSHDFFVAACTLQVKGVIKMTFNDLSESS